VDGSLPKHDQGRCPVRPREQRPFRRLFYTPDRIRNLGCPLDSLRVSHLSRARLEQALTGQKYGGVGKHPHPAVRPTGLVTWAVQRSLDALWTAWEFAVANSDRLSPPKVEAGRARLPIPLYALLDNFRTPSD